jgi:hypothetical protein
MSELHLHSPMSPWRGAVLSTGRNPPLTHSMMPSVHPVYSQTIASLDEWY